MRAGPSLRAGRVARTGATRHVFGSQWRRCTWLVFVFQTAKRDVCSLFSCMERNFSPQVTPLLPWVGAKVLRILNQTLESLSQQRCLPKWCTPRSSHNGTVTAHRLSSFAPISVRRLLADSIAHSLTAVPARLSAHRDNISQYFAKRTDCILSPGSNFHTNSCQLCPTFEPKAKDVAANTEQRGSRHSTVRV